MSRSLRRHSRAATGQSNEMSAAPMLDALEARLLMTNNITSNFHGGHLTLTGDKGDNQFQITQVNADEFEIAGTGGTTIDGLASIIRKITGQLTIRTGAGDDSLRITESFFKRLHIDMGTGGDELTLGDVGYDRSTLLGGKGFDHLIDLGRNEVARKIHGFEKDLYPDDPFDSYALEDRSQIFDLLLRNERTATIDERVVQRFITDYRINKDLRGRVGVRPVYSDIVTGILGKILATVSPDRTQVLIEAELTQTVLDGVNQLGIRTPLGMKFIDQPVISTLRISDTIMLPNGATFAPAQADRVNGPLASQIQLAIRPTIVDTNASIPQDELEIDLDLASLYFTAQSQSLRPKQYRTTADAFSSGLRFLVADGVTAELDLTTQHLLSAGLETSRDKDGNRVLNTLARPFDSGFKLQVTPKINLDRGTIALDLDVSESVIADVEAVILGTAIGRQPVQLPVIESLRAMNQVTLLDGQSVTLAEASGGSRYSSRDNIQVAIEAEIVSVSQRPMAEIGIDFTRTTPTTDAGRQISTLVSGGGISTFSAETQRFVISDFPSTFGLGRVGSMSTAINPLITGWTYGVEAPKTNSLRTVDGTVTFSETFVDRRTRSAFGTPFGTQTIISGLTRTESVTNKVPLLGDIPLVGKLFRGRQSRVETELLVFITPRTVRVDSEF